MTTAPMAGKRPKLTPGAIFSVPLNDGYFAFGRLTPQVGIADFYNVKSREPVRSAVLEKFPTFRLQPGITHKPLRSGRWVIYDSIEYPFEGFKLVPFRMGNLVCCGTKIVNGFVHTSSASREATENELETIPPLSIANTELVESRLSDYLCSAPTI